MKKIILKEKDSEKEYLPTTTIKQNNNKARS